MSLAVRKQVLAVLLLSCATGGVAQPPGFRVDWAVTPESGTQRTEYTFTAVPVGGSGPYAYIWNLGDGSPTEPTAATVRHSFYRPGTYTVQLTGRDASGQVVVTRKPFTVGTTELAVDCEVVGLATGTAPLRVELRATPENCVGPCSWKWESGDGQVVLGQNYAEFDYRHPGTFRAKVTLEDALTFTPEHYDRRATCEQVIRLFPRGEPGEPAPGGSAPAAPARFAYAVNVHLDTVTAFTVNQATGALTNIGSVPTGDNPVHVAVAPSGRFAYVANLVSETVSAYSIDVATGALTSVGTAAAGNFPSWTTVHPNGRFAYTTNRLDVTISRFSIDPSTGALTSLGPTPSLRNPNSIAIDPTGRFAYVASSSRDIEAFSIDAGTGGLTSLGTIVSPAHVSAAVDPSGRSAYFAAGNTDVISGYSIDGTTGALTSIGTVGSGGDVPHTTIVNPNGRFTHTANNSSRTVVTHRRDAGTGALTLVHAVATADEPVGVVADFSGRVVYAFTGLGGGNSIYVYRLDEATGSLTLQSTTTTSTPRWMALAP